jgi:hypothetical protein
MLNTIDVAFTTAVIQNNTLHFPLEISPKIYKIAKSMLSNIRGQYMGKGSCGHFEFPFNPTDIVEKFIATGEWPKKNPYALFPTPKSVVDYAIEYTFAGAQMWAGYEKVRILEPSAGRGDFIDEIVKDFKKHGIACEVTCAEIDPVNIAILKDKGYSVIEGDFLNVDVELIGMFDLVITNPPFQRETYVRHINHSQKFLTMHGKLVAVIPTKLFTSTTKVGCNLKHRVAACNIGEFHDCIFDEGTFKDTDIETMLVTLPSVGVEKGEMKRTVDYAAHLMCLCLNNVNHINTRINACQTNEALDSLMPYLASVYLEQDPYAFVNEDVLNASQSNFAKSRELNDKSSVKEVLANSDSTENPALNNELATKPTIANKDDEVGNVLSKINDVLAVIDEKVTPTQKVVTLKVPKRKRKMANDLQMEMFA